MRDFLRNLALLAVLAIAIYIIFPDIIPQILGVYSGLGIIPIVIFLVILAAIPRRRRR